jgi:hypothetical protein
LRKSENFKDLSSDVIHKYLGTWHLRVLIKGRKAVEQLCQDSDPSVAAHSQELLRWLEALAEEQAFSFPLPRAGSLPRTLEEIDKAWRQTP